jgi:hypothetical protein
MPDLIAAGATNNKWVGAMAAPAHAALRSPAHQREHRALRIDGLGDP